jgi:hypothetical protein
MVPKKAGCLIIVQDFYQMNEKSRGDMFFMKDVDKCINGIGHGSYTTFINLDMSLGFWQIHMEEQSKHLTVVVMPNMAQFK